MYKNFDCKIEDVVDKGIVTVYANAFGNVDSDKDRSHYGSFTKTIQDSFHRVKWFQNHGFYGGDNFLLGVPLEAIQDQRGLKVTGQLNMKKQISRDILEDYKLYAENGRTLEHSLAVDAVKYEEDKETGIRDVYEWKWWEYSTLTTWGANEDTPMVSFKSMKINEAIDLLEKMLNGNYSEERMKQIEIQFNKLKSLISEKPLDSTSQGEPVDIISIIKKSKLIKS